MGTSAYYAPALGAIQMAEAYLGAENRLLAAVVWALEPVLGALPGQLS